MKDTALQDSQRFPSVLDSRGDYAVFTVAPAGYRSLLQRKHITAMRARIKRIPSREEVGCARDRR